MAESEVQIVNSALTKIGEERIVSLEDERKAARSAAHQYPIVRDRLLRQFFWNFAIRRATLAEISEPPAFGFTRQYALPDDYLRVIGIYDERERVENYTSSRAPWKVEGNRFLFTDTDVSESDTEVVQIFYIARVTDVSLFDANFSEALALKLAVDLAYDLSTGVERVADLESLFQAAIREARIADAIEGTPEVVTASDWIDSRFFYNGPPRIGPVFT